MRCVSLRERITYDTNEGSHDRAAGAADTPCELENGGKREWANIMEEKNKTNEQYGTNTYNTRRCWVPSPWDPPEGHTIPPKHPPPPSPSFLDALSHWRALSVVAVEHDSDRASKWPPREEASSEGKEEASEGGEDERGQRERRRDSEGDGGKRTRWTKCDARRQTRRRAPTRNASSMAPTVVVAVPNREGVALAGGVPG